MTLTDLLPWKRGNRVPVRRIEEEEEFRVPAVRREINRLFDDFFSSPFGLTPFAGWPETLSRFYPSMDVTETDDEIVVTAELPGMDEKDIDIQLDRSSLVISGEKKSEVEEKKQQYYRVERSYGSFRRSIPLPREIDQDKVEASFKKGVLSITLPKTAEARKQGNRVPVRTN